MTGLTMVFASDNRHKYDELHALFKPLGIDLHPQAEFGVTSVEETGSTFVENALIKAKNASQLAHLPAIADDSGLVVKALNGAPGIFSARYAGVEASDQDNRQKLLAALAEQNLSMSAAYYYCALISVNDEHDPTPIIGLGEWHGQITTDEKGEGGFGYDPCFYVSTLGRTAAQMTATEKNTLSHRAKASAAWISKYQSRNQADKP